MTIAAGLQVGQRIRPPQVPCETIPRDEFWRSYRVFFSVIGVHADFSGGKFALLPKSDPADRAVAVVVRRLTAVS
jgi:hypothetical protein